MSLDTTSCVSHTPRMAAPMPRLPDGLTPVQAGRFGLWLLGKISHDRAGKRVAIVPAYRSFVLADAVVKAFLPWTIYEYPGWRRWLSDVLDVAPSTASTYARVEGRLPRKHAKTLARLCRDKAAELLALADQLDEYERSGPSNEALRGFAASRPRRGG